MSTIAEIVQFAVAVGRDALDGNERLPDDVERARATCEELLANPVDLTDADVWALLVTSAALVEEDLVAYLVNDLASGSTDAECPACNRSSSLVVDGEKIWLQSDEAGAGEPGIADPETALPSEIVRLAGRALTAKRPRIANSLELLARRVQCPHCRERSPAMATLEMFRD